MSRLQIDLEHLTVEKIENYISKHETPPLQCDEKTYQRMIDFLVSSWEDSAAANFCLGMLYHYGCKYATGSEFVLAVKYLKLAAHHPAGSYDAAEDALGLLLCHSDEKEALQYLIASVYRENLAAQRALALIYFHQRGFDLAIPFLELSKQYYELGIIYRDHLKQIESAVDYFTKAIGISDLLPFDINADFFVTELRKLDASNPAFIEPLIAYGQVNSVITHGNPVRELLRTILTPSQFVEVETEMLDMAYSSERAHLFMTEVSVARNKQVSLSDQPTSLQKFSRHCLFQPTLLRHIKAFAQHSVFELEELFSRNDTEAAVLEI